MYIDKEEYTKKLQTCILLALDFVYINIFVFNVTFLMNLGNDEEASAPTYDDL